MVNKKVEKPKKLLDIYSDKKGRYLVKFDKELLYRSDETLHADKYGFIVKSVKTEIDLDNKKEVEKKCKELIDGFKSEGGFA